MRRPSRELIQVATGVTLRDEVWIVQDDRGDRVPVETAIPPPTA